MLVRISVPAIISDDMYTNEKNKTSVEFMGVLWDNAGTSLALSLQQTMKSKHFEVIVCTQ